MINNSLVYEKAYKFAIRVVNAYKYLQEDKKEFILSKQLLKSGTSIGANIAEANGETICGGRVPRHKQNSEPEGRNFYSRFFCQDVYCL